MSWLHRGREPEVSTFLIQTPANRAIPGRTQVDADCRNRLGHKTSADCVKLRHMRDIFAGVAGSNPAGGTFSRIALLSRRPGGRMCSAGRQHMMTAAEEVSAPQSRPIAKAPKKAGDSDLLPGDRDRTIGRRAPAADRVCGNDREAL